MTSTSKQLRAAFLAFVMVTSMVAGTVALSGSVAATDGASITTDDGLGVDPATHNVSGQVESNDDSVTFSDIEVDYSVGSNPADVSDVETGDIQNFSVFNTTDGSLVANQSGGGSVTAISANEVSASNNNETLLISTNDNLQLKDEYRVQVNFTDVTNPSSGSSTTDVDIAINTQSTDNPTTTTLTYGTGDEAGTIANSTADTVDSNAVVNVSFDDANVVDEGTVNVNVTNLNTSETTVLIDDGSIVNGSATSNNSVGDGSNAVTETANISVALQEGYYEIGATANDTDGNLIDDTTFGSAFNVDMAGESLKVVPDSSNPLAGSAANVSLVALDQNENELILNDSNVDATSEDLQLSFDDPSNVTDVDRTAQTSAAEVPINHSTGYNVTYEVTYSEVGDLEITANDFGGNLTQGSATQTYTAEISGVSVTADDGTLRADGSDTENVTLQLVDQNDNPVPRSGESVDFGVTSGNSGAAGVQVSEETETDSEGQAVATYNATNAGYEITVSGQSGTYSDSATFNTTPGNVNASNSELRVNGSTNDASGVVTTDLDVAVELKDDGGNAVPNAPVTLTANQSGASFGNAEPMTNDTGIATTTVTLPESSGTLQINASSGAFNASATGNATNNVTVTADSATTLQFSDDSPTSVAPGSQNGVTIEAVDQYGNVNESTSGTVTLTSDDTSLVGVDADGQESSSSSLSTGVAGFQAYANSTNTGTATLSATIPDANISNVSQDITVASPDGLDVSIDRNIASSDVTESGVVQNATLTAQLVDSNGDALGINGEEISFARQNGNAATLDATTNHTVSDGSTTVQINSTSNTGETTFLAVADNYSVQGSGTIVTTGAPDAIGIDAPATVTQGESVNVSAGYVDSEERVVPRTTSIKMSTEIGSFETRNKQPEFNENGQAVATYNYTAPTDDSGNETLTAIGGGNTGSAMLTVEAAASTVDATISADPSNTSATSTHTVTATLSENADSVGSSLGGVEVDYSGTGADVSNVDQSDIESVTINGDDVSDDLSSASASNNGETLTVGFGGSYNLEAGDEVEITYANAQNPDTEDTYDVTVTVNPQSGADSGTASLTIGETGDGPAIVGDTPAQDLDGDGTFEDVNGDGTFDIVDVNAIFQNRNSDAVQNNPGAFDFNGDGKFDIVDVNRLFQDAQ